MKYVFETEMEVRDYECDIEGIVNNANYLHYAEHTRHLFLQKCGLSFAEMHRRGIDAVVARMKLEYKIPLQCDDKFISRLWIEKDGFKYIFHQDFFKFFPEEQREKMIFRANVMLVCIVNGRLAESTEYDEAFKPYINE
jgi:acyl-CoA thioester hydrolase